VIRRNQHQVFEKNIHEKLLVTTLEAISSQDFPTLNGFHALETAVGIENHYTCLIHVVLKNSLQSHLAIPSIRQEFSKMSSKVNINV
jgi:hypothetical protein